MHNTVFMKWCVLLAAVLLAGWGLPASARAGLAVSPLKQEVSLRPGETGTVYIKFANQIRKSTTGAEGATMKLVDVLVMENGTLDFPAPGTQKNSAGKWLTLNKQKVSVEPGKGDQLEITVTPPPQTQPGEYYAAVLVTMDAPNRTAAGLEVQCEVASGIFITVLGQTLTKQAKVTRCELQWPADHANATAAEPSKDTSTPKLVVALKNVGTGRFDAHGKMRIIDTAGNRVVMTSVLNCGRPCIFSGDIRLFEGPLTKALPAGKYLAKVDLDYESSWSKAYQSLPFEITPEQATLLAALKQRQDGAVPGINIGPTRFAQTIPAGGSRNLGLAIKSTADVPVHCTFSVTPTGDNDIESWLTVGPDDFRLEPAGRKSVVLKIAVPADARPGKYTAVVAIDSNPEGSNARRVEIPVEILVKAER
ncbi:MAG: hypothetical protein WCI73_06130 [Phycisphaerae bacterium]